tara:strand:+ start:804 stop:2579 length:1776 start_codon:yes stop_codon:yes gene_type:complete
MAKKQGINYNPNTALIQGAGVAYKNYDNMPGMYAGLDKITKAGTEMMKGAVEGFEAEQKKKEKEAKEAEAKKAQQDKDWYDISGSVYENAGSFMKDVEYKDTVSQLTALKPRLIAAKKSGNPEEIAAVMTEFNNIKASVNDHKEFRENVSNPEFPISNAMKHSGVKPGDNGEDHNFLTGLLKEDYKIVRKGGQTYYNVGGVEKTMKEIKDMTIYRNNVPYDKYSKAVINLSEAKNFDRDNTEYFIRNNIIPQEINELRAFLADDGFGNGETFLQLLNKKENKAAIKQEIMNSVFNTDGGDISPDEWKNFTNAIVDPKNKFWKGDENAWKTESTKIATEQLTNGIENKWNDNQKPKGGTDIIEKNRLEKGTIKLGEIMPNGYRKKFNAGEINGIIEKIEVGTGFRFNGNEYAHIDGKWSEKKKDDKDFSAIADGTVDDLVYNVFKSDHEVFSGLKTDKVHSAASGEVSDDQERKQGDFELTIRNILDAGDNTASDALNQQFNLSKRKGSTIAFAPFSRDRVDIKAGVGDNILTNDLMLINPQTNTPVLDKDNNIIRIPSGKNKNYAELDTSVKEILRLLEEANIDTDPLSPK